MYYNNCLKIYADAQYLFEEKTENIRKEIARDLFKEYAEELHLNKSDISNFLFDEDSVRIFLNDLDIVIENDKACFGILFDEEVKYSDDKRITLHDDELLCYINGRSVNLETLISSLSQKQRDWMIKRMYLFDNNC